MPQVASYFAKVGVDIDTSAFARVDKYFNALEKRMNKLTSSSKSFAIPVRFVVDQAKALAYLQKTLNSIGKNVTIKIANVDINTRNVIRKLNEKLSLNRGGNHNISINAIISASSIRNMQGQIRAALNNLTISPNITPRIHSPRNTGGSGGGNSGGRGRISPRAFNPWMNGDTGWSPMAAMGALRGGLPAMVAAYAGVKGLAANNAAVQQNYAQETAMNTLFANAIQPDGSTVDLRDRANELLNNHVDYVGLNLNQVRPDFTNFMASSMPAIGFDQSASAFKAFTKFGMVRGADPESIHRALVAIGQMASKGQVYAEELKQQLGDASGYGEMLPIFAQAWQEHLHGQGSASNLVGQQAIAQLMKDMKDGKVKTPDVLPIVGRIANERSASGIEAIANSPGAMQARAGTAATRWTDAFSKGGGAEAWVSIWKAIADEINRSAQYADKLGAGFDYVVQTANQIRVSIYDINDVLSGKSDSLDKNNFFKDLIPDDTLKAMKQMKDAIHPIATDLMQMANSEAKPTFLNLLIETLNNAVKAANMLIQAMNVVWNMNDPEKLKKAFSNWMDSQMPTGLGGIGVRIGQGIRSAIGLTPSPMSDGDPRNDPRAGRSAGRQNSSNLQFGLNQEPYMPTLIQPNTPSSYRPSGNSTSIGTQNINVSVSGTNATAQEIASATAAAFNKQQVNSIINTHGASQPR